MRSAVIVMLFLFSMLFLGAQAAQLDPPQPRQQMASQPVQPAGANMLHTVGFVGQPAN